MPVVFRLPDLGEGLAEAEIVSWHVAVGDRVVIDQPLVSIETDKAIVDVPSPQTGRIAALHGAPGDVIRIGAPLVEFDGESAADRGAIVGDLHAAPPASQAAGGRIRAAPAVRRLAAERGIDLGKVTGTGPGGAITRADVESAGSAGAAGAPLRGVRRAMLANMTRAGRQVVAATITDDADIDGWPEGADTTARLVRAVVAGCRAEPALNAWFDSASGRRVVHERVDLGIAVETDEGLFAPVLRDAAARDIESLRQGIDAIKRDAKDRAFAPEELAGPTFTLSNFGMIGGRYAALVVVPPQVAILGAGRAEDRVVAVDRQAAVRRSIPVSLSFDHRVVTGVEATRFLNAVVADLERTD